MYRNIIADTTCNALFVSLMLLVNATAFDKDIHSDVTKEQIRPLVASVAGKEKKFSESALIELAKANMAIDDPGSWAKDHPERHFTNERFLESSTRLVELKQQIVAAVTSQPPSGYDGRRLLGGALHTLQDFYSHSNWVELGNATALLNLGRFTMADPPVTLKPCPVDPDHLGDGGGGGLTTAYYVGNTGCGVIPDGKCYHGNYNNFFAGFFCDAGQTGINKDKPGFGNGFHQSARLVAEAGTADYVKQVLDDLNGNDKALSALLDLRGAVGFAVDTTGSMGSSIAGVRQQITALVNAIRNDPDRKPDVWILCTFNDPSVGTPLVTDSADTLLSAVNSLSASGGGDCPELSQEGLRRSVNAAPPNSQLYLYTDASAKDAGLANTVISAAQKKAIRISCALTGSCSPIDPAYIREAAETGGQLFFLSPSEIPALFDLVQPQLSGDLVTVVDARGALANADTTIPVPVDSTMTTLILSVSIDTRNFVRLRRPSGALVVSTDSDAKISTLSGATIYTIQNPVPGQWQAEVGGNGTYTAIAKGNSPLDFYSFAFVSPDDNVDGGFHEIEGQPLAGTTATGDAVMKGRLASASFDLATENGAAIASTPLVTNYPGAVSDHFVGSFTLPSVPFRLRARGTDSSGFAFQRQFPTVYRAQTVGVEVQAGLGGTILRAQTTPFEFIVRNLGPAAAFQLGTSNNLGFGTSLSANSLNLAEGASATITVSVSVPAGTPVGTQLTITFTATKANDPTIFNSAILQLQVAENSPDTVTVCHKRATSLTFPSGSPEIQRHLDHGDSIGSCLP